MNSQGCRLMARRRRADRLHLLLEGRVERFTVSSQVYDTRDSSGYMPSDHRPVLTTFQIN
jgi:hypothetical protein